MKIPDRSFPILTQEFGVENVLESMTECSFSFETSGLI